MAFVMKFPDDPNDDYYANVESSVPGGSGGWGDVMLVKALLNLVYSPNKGAYKSPLRTPLTVNDRFDNATATLIRHYQSTFQKRARPDGKVSRAPASSFSKGVKYTIINLQLEAGRALAILGNRGLSVLGVLRTRYPALAGPLAEKAAPGTLSEVARNDGGPHEVFRNP
jgi:hypothetical protein